MQIIVQNMAVEYSDQGAGQVILFLHGWQDQLHTFDQLTQILSSTHRLIGVDLPGFGKSEMPPTNWNLDDYIAFTQAFIQKLNITVDVIVGHSFGGRIAIKGVATRKLLTPKVVLISSAGIARDRAFRNVTMQVLAKTAGWILYLPPFLFYRQRLRQKIYRAIGSDYLSAGPMQHIFLNVIAEDLSGYARLLAIPTLLIWGTNDTATPLRDGEKLSRLIPRAQLQTVSGAGHFVHRDHAQAVAKIMRTFL